MPFLNLDRDSGLSRLQVFRGFLRNDPRLGHDRLLSRPIQFIIVSPIQRQMSGIVIKSHSNPEGRAHILGSISDKVVTDLITL
jgi:hypothetical protein